MMARNLASPVIILLCWNIICGGVVCAFFMPDKADIYPSDALVFIGETLKVQCQIKQGIKDVAASDVYFTVDSEGLNWTVSQDNVTVINSTTVIGSIEITNSFSKYSTVTCCTKNNPRLNSAGVYVERPIKNITNFTGVFYYDNSTVVSTWSLGETYLNPSRIIVNIDWNPNLSPNLSGNNCTISTNESCSFESRSQDIIFIRINVTANCSHRYRSNEYIVPLYDTQTSSLYQFAVKDNTKSGPPKVLTVVNKTSTCVNFTWKDPIYLESDKYSNASYRLETKVTDEPEFRIVVHSAVRQNSTDTIQVCQLVPDTKYTLSVQVRAGDVNPWSDRTIVEFTTEEDVPVSGPPITDTSYQVGECVKNARKVFIYWKDPPKSDLHGELTKFEVVRDNISVPLRAGSNFYTDNINCDSSSEILVYTATKVGLSLTPSRMHIPKKSQELTLKNDLMFRVEDTTSSLERSLVNVSIKWNPGDQLENITLILYMCTEMYIPNTCFNDFMTKEISMDKKAISMTDLPSSTNMFGYALKADNGRKQGIQWTSCIYRADSKPAKPTGLTVSPGSQAKSLLITWTSSECSKITKVLIVKYHLFICSQPVKEESSINHTCSHIIINDMRKNSYSVTDLQGGHPYSVYIQAESPTMLGFMSDPEVGTPNTPGTDTGQIIGTAFGTVTAVLVMGLLIFCLARSCIKSRKRIEADATKLVRSYTHIETKTSRQTSDESGVYSDSNPNSTQEGSGETSAAAPRLPNYRHPQLNTCSESNAARDEPIQDAVPSTLATLTDNQDTNGIFKADFFDCHNSNKSVSTSGSGPPYIFIKNASLAHEESNSDSLSDTLDNRDDSDGSNTSSVIHRSSTDLEFIKLPQPQSFINLTSPVSNTFTSPIGICVAVHDSTLQFNSQTPGSFFESPANTAVSNTVSPFTTHSNIHQIQSSERDIKSTARFQEVGRNKPPENSDVIQKQINSRGEVRSPNSGLSDQQCLDYVRFSPDGRIDSYNSQDDCGALTVSSGHKSDDHILLSDNDYIKQNYVSSTQGPDNSSDQSIEVINHGLEQTSLLQQIKATILTDIEDNPSWNSDIEDSFADSDFSNLNMHSHIDQINEKQRSLGDDKSQINGESQTQVTQEDSDGHLSNTDSNNQAIMDISKIDGSSINTSGNEVNCAGYVSLDCLRGYKDESCVPHSDDYVRQILEDAESDESLESSHEELC